MPGPPDRERWQQIETILDGAFELEGVARDSYLIGACRGDDELRAEVDALLSASIRELTLPGLPEVVASAFRDGTISAGEEIGPYRIVRSIGRGGMGEVFEAVDSRLGRRVAIKLLPRRGRALGADERFLREARAASALDHPNICTLYDVGQTEAGDPYLVMAYYPGETLEERLARGPLPVETARDLALQVGRGLESAHRAGIVHRDVKPANILVTESGQAKILDFGIARLLGEAGLTATGAQLGTPAYMSPEQARGEAAGPRTDVWALGLLLYEMLTGARPFRGQPQAIIHAILHRDPEPLRRQRRDVPSDLEGVVKRALSKDPARRYRAMTEMLVTLESPAAEPQARRRKPWPAIGGAAAVLLALALAGSWAGRRPAATEPATVTVPEVSRRADVAPPRLAVFRFRNLSGDPELEWLSEGIAELLLASLTQSAEISVISSGRLARLADELGLPAVLESDVPTELLRSASERGEFDTAVTGSFARAGTALRVVLKVTTDDGKILKSAQVDGESEASLFAMIDELGAAMRNALEAEPASPVAKVREITTASIEAWRFYTEALALDRQGKRPEAIALLEEAVDLDPGFALAWVALGKLHKNLGRISEARELTRQAVEHAERLPAGQRYEVVGAFHATRWSTLGLAAEAYEAAVDLRPAKETPRNNLAKIYTDLERYPEAVDQYRTLIDAGTEYLGTYTALANTYAGMGRFETGYQLLLDFGRDHAGNWLWHLYTGWHLTEWGRLDEALARFEEASRMRPGEFFIHYARWRALVLLDRGEEARLEAQRMSASDQPFERWRGGVSEARNQTLLGRSGGALAALDAAIRARPAPDASTALARCWKAELWLARGDAAEALSEARQAIVEGEGEWPGLQARFLAALAHQRLGQPESAGLLDELRQLASRHPNRVEERQIHHLEGLLAEARGDLPEALTALRRAEALLPQEGVEFHWHVYPHHVPIWHALGRVELSAGRPAEAARWLEQALDAGAERLESPLAYVRGLYLLGESRRRLGQDDRARQAYGRFALAWRDGDLDRERVERAAGFQ